jgi:hypothetical protein
MQHTRIQTPLMGPPAKCYTTHSLIKKRHRQDNWNLHLYWDTN